MATDINNNGRIVGFTNANLQPKPATWYRGLRTILPTLGGQNGLVNDINQKDEAVGYSQTATGLQRATLWVDAARPVQIDTLLDDDSQGYVIHDALAINDKGQIAAVRRLINNRIEPLLLTPHRCH